MLADTAWAGIAGHLLALFAVCGYNLAAAEQLSPILTLWQTEMPHDIAIRSVLSYLWKTY